MKKTLLSLLLSGGLYGAHAQYQNISGVRVGEQGHTATWTGIAHNSLAVTGTNYMILQNNTGNYTLINKANTGDGFIGFRVGNADKMTIDNSGFVTVGVGSNDPRLQLSSYWSFGNSYYNSAGTYTSNPADNYIRLMTPDRRTYKNFAAANLWSQDKLTIHSFATGNGFSFYPQDNAGRSADNLVLQKNNGVQTTLEVRSRTDSYMGQVTFSSPTAAQAEAVIGSGPTTNTFGIRYKPSNGVLRDMLHITSQDRLYLLDNNVTGDKVVVRGEICVTANGTCDYVFKDDYKLRSIEELDGFIKQNGHLPGVKNDREVKEAGEVNLLEQANALLEKTEEFSLYIIELNKKLKAQQEIIEKQQQQIEQLLKKQLMPKS